MKNIRQVVFVFAALLMIAGGITLILLNKEGKGNTVTEKTVYNEETIQKLTMKVGACEVKLIEGTGSEMILDCEGFKKNDVSVSVQNGELSIRRNSTGADGFHLFGINLSGSDDKKKMTLTIPKGKEFTEADLELGAVSITIEDLHTRKLSISVGAGELEAEAITASDSAKVEVGAGSVTLKNAELREASLKCGVGELKVDGSILGRSKLDCGVGEISIELSNAKEDEYFGQLDCGLGSIRFGDNRIKGSGKQDFGESDAANEMDVKCGIGEVNVRFE